MVAWCSLRYGNKVVIVVVLVFFCANFNPFFPCPSCNSHVLPGAHDIKVCVSFIFSSFFLYHE